MRYVNLCIVLTLTMICPAVKKRFPTMDHLVDAGFLLSDEQVVFESMNAKTSHPNYWMPLVWAATIVTQAKKEGRIVDDHSITTLIDEINKIRLNCSSLLSYDWISIPLVYTQVTDNFDSVFIFQYSTKLKLLLIYVLNVLFSKLKIRFHQYVLFPYHSTFLF